MELLIHNIHFAGEETADGWVLIRGERIVGKGHGQLPDCANRYDGQGGLLMPGVIDCHVHFREPGLTHKADIASESRAALAGGVTSYLDMPNTKPATTTVEAWQQKMDIAAEKSLANYGFFIGATNDNLEELKKADYTRIPGVKLFMGSSTGNMLVDDASAISRIFAEVPAIVAVHAEDQTIIDANVARAREQYPSGVPVSMHSAIRSAEACYRSTALAVEMAKKYNHRLHVCHLTTARELELLDDPIITSEVSPHHLLWTQNDYDNYLHKGTRIKMNPAVKTVEDRQELMYALQIGLIDMVATDHAPHLLSEKEGDALTAASGAPLVQFALPLMLGLTDDEVLVERTMCRAPSRVYGIDERGVIVPDYYADLTLVRKVEPYRVSDDMVVSKCGWTPLDGITLEHQVVATWVNGSLAYENGQFHKANPMPLTFTQYDS